jgi:hypothetical protein
MSKDTGGTVSRKGKNDYPEGRELHWGGLSRLMLIQQLRGAPQKIARPVQAPM